MTNQKLLATGRLIVAALIAILTLLAVQGCDPGADLSDPGAEDTSTTLEPSTTTTRKPPSSVGQKGPSVAVASVIDGDTIQIAPPVTGIDTVRLIGIDTPETRDPRRGVQPLGKEASAYTSRSLRGQQVVLEFDVEKTDRYGRLLAYVWLADGRMFNRQIVKEGYAQVATFPPNVKYTDLLLADQKKARELGKGLWGLPADEKCKETDRGNDIGGGCEDGGNGEGGGGSGPGGGSKDSGGPDRDCPDFATQKQAQQFFLKNGGPGKDPHRLDRDKDGIACETLP